MQPVNLPRVDGAAGTHPVQVAQQQLARAKPPLPSFEGKTTFEALNLQLGHDHALDLSQCTIESIKGKFDSDGKGEDKTIKAGVVTIGSEKYFKFDVTWQAKVKGPNGETKDVEFKQTVFTNKQLPKEGCSLQEYETAKQEAFQLAKSYELLQKNMTRLDPGKSGEQAQIKAIREENKIIFKKVADDAATPNSLSNKHEIKKLEAFSAVSNTKLELSAMKASKVSGQEISRLALYANKRIVVDGNSGLSYSSFERGVVDKEGSEYTHYLKQKADLDKQKLTNTNVGFSRLAQAESSDAVKDLRRQLVDIGRPPNDEVHLRENGQNIDEVRAHQTNLQKEILAKSNVPAMKENLAEQKKLLDDYLKTYLQFEEGIGVEAEQIEEMQSVIIAQEAQIEEHERFINGLEQRVLTKLEPEAAQVQPQAEELTEARAMEVLLETEENQSPVREAAMDIVFEEVDEKSVLGEKRELTKDDNELLQGAYKFLSANIRELENKGTVPKETDMQRFEKTLSDLKSVQRELKSDQKNDSFIQNLQTFESRLNELKGKIEAKKEELAKRPKDPVLLNSEREFKQNYSLGKADLSSPNIPRETLMTSLAAMKNAQKAYDDALNKKTTKSLDEMKLSQEFAGGIALFEAEIEIRFLSDSALDAELEVTEKEVSRAREAPVKAADADTVQENTTTASSTNQTEAGELSAEAKVAESVLGARKSVIETKNELRKLSDECRKALNESKEKNQSVLGHLTTAQSGYTPGEKTIKRFSEALTELKELLSNSETALNESRKVLEPNDSKLMDFTRDYVALKRSITRFEENLTQLKDKI